MKKLLIVTLLLMTSTAAYAFNPTLENNDSKTYRYKVICGGSTSNTSIGGNTTQTLTSGNCKLDIAGVGRCGG